MTRKAQFCFCAGGATDQDWGSHEQVIDGVVQQVEEGGRVQIGVTHHLAGEQRLPGGAAQEAAHLAVGDVHPVGQHLQTGAGAASAEPRGTRHENT